MPYQPRQYGLVSMPQGPDPLRTLSDMMALGSQLENYATERKERAVQQRIEEAFKTAKGNPEKAADILESHGEWMAGRKIRDNAMTIRQQTVEQVQNRLDQHKTLYGQGAQFLKEIEQRPELYPDLRPRLVELATALDPRFAQEIPETYEPQKVRGMLQFAEGAAVQLDSWGRAAALAKQKFTAKQDFATALKTDQEIVSHLFSTAGDQATWDQALEGAQYVGVSEDVLAQVGKTWSKDAQERARQIGLTPEQRGTETRAAVTAKRADEQFAETKRHNRVMEGISRQRESRLSEGGGGLSDSARAVAERWKATQLEELERDLTDPTKSQSLTMGDVRRRQLQIENSYRAQLGLKPLKQLPASWLGEGEPSPAAPRVAVSNGEGALETTVTEAELKLIAERRGTTVEQERARATAAGFRVIR